MAYRLDDDEVIRWGDVVNATENTLSNGWIYVEAHNIGKTAGSLIGLIALRPVDPLIKAMIEAKEKAHEEDP